MRDGRLIQATADKIGAATEALEDAWRILDEMSASSEVGDLARELREMVAEVVDGEMLPCFRATEALAR